MSANQIQLKKKKNLRIKQSPKADVQHDCNNNSFTKKKKKKKRQTFPFQTSKLQAQIVCQIIVWLCTLYLWRCV